ncbi:MAG: mechanosensitive ion channel [Oscillospiraceae bacterium]|nr:mechanosensitive ion channel [Oscillospiraceae bacterium]
MNLTDTLDSVSKISIGTISLMTLISAVLVFLVCLLVITIVLRTVDHIQTRSKLDNAVKGFIRSGVKVGLWIVALIVVASKLGIETSSLVALVGVAGLALSLSVQGLLSNIFSGFTILTSKPFTSGDYVELDNVSGTVSKVELLYTTIVTIDNKVVYIPNSQVTGAKIINYTREKERRLDLFFEASYNDDTEDVKAALMDVIKAEERILKDPAPVVGLNSYKQSSVEYTIRVWVKREDYVNMLFVLNENVRKAFRERGIEMTYDHLNVHIVEK